MVPMFIDFQCRVALRAGRGKEKAYEEQDPDDASADDGDHPGGRGGMG